MCLLIPPSHFFALVMGKNLWFHKPLNLCPCFPPKGMASTLSLLPGQFLFISEHRFLPLGGWLQMLLKHFVCVCLSVCVCVCVCVWKRERERMHRWVRLRSRSRFHQLHGKSAFWKSVRVHVCVCCTCLFSPLGSSLKAKAVIYFYNPST